MKARQLFFLILFFFSVFISQAQTDLELLKKTLKGGVKSITEYTYCIKDKNETPKDKGEKQAYYLFDNKGNLLEDYDLKSKKNTERTFYKYDEKNNNTELLKYKNDSILEYKISFKYDELGNNVEKNYFSETKKHGYKNILKYDENNNLKEQLSYNSSNEFTDKCVWNYDVKNMQYELTFYVKDSVDGSKTIVKYNAQGFDLERSVYNNGILNAKWEHQYDEYGNETEEVYYKKDSVLTRKYNYEYEFDKFGNWTKKYKTDHSPKHGDLWELIFVTERIIEYY